MKRILGTVLTLFTIFSVIAEESAPPAPPQGGWGRGGRRGPGGPGGPAQFMNQLRERYPDEVAELERLRESDPEAFRSKMFEFMRRVGPEMGMGRGHRAEQMSRRTVEPTAEQLAEIKKKFPEEFAEYEKLKESEPEKARELIINLMRKTFGDQAVDNPKNLRDRNRTAVEQIKVQLKQRYPERYAEIEKLEQANPDAARKALRELYNESGLRIRSGAGEVVYEWVDPKNPANAPQRGAGQFNGPPGFRMGPGGGGGGRR